MSALRVTSGSRPLCQLSPIADAPLYRLGSGPLAEPIRGLRQGLQDSGYVEGENLTSNIAALTIRQSDCRPWPPNWFVGGLVSLLRREEVRPHWRHTAPPIVFNTVDDLGAKRRPEQVQQLSELARSPRRQCDLREHSVYGADRKAVGAFACPGAECDSQGPSLCSILHWLRAPSHLCP
jgi:hypothetical protein